MGIVVKRGFEPDKAKNVLVRVYAHSFWYSSYYPVTPNRRCTIVLVVGRLTPPTPARGGI
eukprot:scaffold536970_cov38-Prasinocladus_malaysianus.AAC.1